MFQAKKCQLRLENYLMRKINRRRGSLLLRRDQVMPRIEPDGHERNIVKMVHCDSPPPEKPPIISIFNYGSEKYERRGLMTTLTRRDRGHNVITEWLGTPHVTDVIMKELGLANVDDNIISMNFLEKDQQTVGPDKSQGAGGEFVPVFPGLAVVGTRWKSGTEDSAPKVSRPNTSTQPKHAGQHHHHSPRQVHKTGYITQLESGRKSTLRYLQPRSFRDEGVVLYFGENRLSWYPENKEVVRKCCTVEIGSTAEFGQSAVSSTTMRNAGTVVIRYTWIRCDHKDTFELGRYTNLRFAFDSWGGVILPGETHRVPCLFKANDPGYFSEVGLDFI